MIEIKHGIVIDSEEFEEFKKYRELKDFKCEFTEYAIDKIIDWIRFYLKEYGKFAKTMDHQIVYQCMGDMFDKINSLKHDTAQKLYIGFEEIIKKQSDANTES